MQRRNRLSRSRDFDAVYRHGRSASTRYLTLHWFAREAGGDDSRLGLAVPKAVGTAATRNRVKRQLRELWRARVEAGAIAASNDYVLSVRAGLPEAVDARGHEWLAERLDEVLEQAGSATRAPASAGSGETP